MSLLSNFLSGVRVLDLSRHLPGPLCTLYLADMGADVLKIEPPQGDEIRSLGPLSDDGRPVFFDAVNAGKTTRRMDLRQPDQKAEFLDLVRDIDIVVESFRPGVLNRLGVDYEVLKAVNPRLILCSLNGFGSGGVNDNRAGHDNIYLALAGVLDRNRDKVGRPTFFEPPLADSAASLTAAIAILGALRHCERTGEGCHIEAPLSDAVMPLQMLQIAELEATGEIPTTDSGLFTGGTAYYNTYATKDGRHIALGAVEPKFWSAFCVAANRPEWIARQDEPRPQTALGAEVASLFESLSLQQARDIFEPIDCCFAPVLDLQEAVQSEHFQTRGILQRGDDGKTQVLFPVHVNGLPPLPRAPIREIESLCGGKRAAC